MVLIMYICMFCRGSSTIHIAMPGRVNVCWGFGGGYTYVVVLWWVMLSACGSELLFLILLK